MHVSDAICEADLGRGEWVPTYYCEDCGGELRYPPDRGRCDACEGARAELLTIDLGRAADLFEDRELPP